MKSSDEKEVGKMEYIRKPELVIGLVGPVGLRWHQLLDVFREEFARVSYAVVHIRLSHLLEEICGAKEKQEEDRYARLDRLMNQGDKIRAVLEHTDAVGFLAVAAIQRVREQVNRDRAMQVKQDRAMQVKNVSDDVKYKSASQTPMPRILDLGPLTKRDNALLDLGIDERDFATVPLSGCAYILRSLKTPAEVQLLRRIYGECFFLIAAYSSHDARIAGLAEHIATSRRDSDPTRHRYDAERLTERDEKDSESPEGKKGYGQNVRDTFALPDLFVDADSPPHLSASIRRFVEAMFGYQFHTPSRDEYGMFHATAASRRSADLSRQVGATITTSEGDVVAVGCNEVPKAGGGLYWAGDYGDSRDYSLGKDVRHEITDVMLREAIYRLKDAASEIVAKGDMLDKLEGNAELKSAISKDPEFMTALITEVFRGLEQDQAKALQGSRVRGLLEFSRTVHAEMAALSDAALRGISVRDGTMYVTTLPCHMCARHVVAAGIKRVVYIEPYAKSMVRRLYPDSVSIDSGCGHDSVKFEPFLGFAPQIYLRFFDIPEDPKREYHKGDQQGKVIAWNKLTMQCRTRRYVNFYLFIEMRSLKYIGAKLCVNKTDIELVAEKDRLEAKEPQYGDKRLYEWLEARRNKIEDDLETAAPRWMKLAILAHQYM